MNGPQPQSVVPSEDLGSDLARADSNGSAKDRFAFVRKSFVAMLFAIVLIELCGELGEKMGYFNDLTEAGFNLFSMSLWCAVSLWVFLRIRDRSMPVLLMSVGILFLFFSHVVSFTDEFPALKDVPVFGEDGALNDSIVTVLRVLGLGLLLTSLFSTLLHLNEIRSSLLADRRNLSEKIESQVETEKALRESEERYRLLFDNANDIIYSIDLEGNFLSINYTAVLLTGYPREEILRMSIADILEPHEVGKVREMIRRRLEGTAPETYEVEVRTKEGRSLPLEISTRIQSSSKEHQIIQGIARDITERRRAEKMQLAEIEILERIASGDPLLDILETQVRSIEELADGMIGSVLLLDSDGKRLHLGAAPSLPDEYNRAVDGFEIGPKAGSCGTAAYLGASIVVSDIQTDPLWAGFKDIAAKFGLRACWSTPILSSKGKVLGTFAMYYREPKSPEDYHLAILQQAVQLASIAIERDRNEMERRALEARVQQAEKMESLGLLAGGIAHDFNNLLTGVLGHASLALMDLPATSPARDSLRQIEIAAARAADLAKQMLAYSGKGQFILQVVDLSGLVEEMAHLLEASISKKAQIKFDFRGDLPPVEADVTQLRQVVLNLITNASEAIGEREGTIRLRTGAMESEEEFHIGSPLPNHLPSGTYVFLEVSDNGVGMDRETQEKIFDPFFTTKFTGRGLGLSAVLGIVRGHDGDIRVYSEPGQGTTIRVMFPRSEKRVEVAATGSAQGTNGGLHGTVLVVDDEETVLQVSKRMLEKCGLSVLTASDGKEGVETFRNHSDEISLVLLDMTMPQMNGEEAFEEIKKIREDARVVLSSGYNEQDAIGRFAGKGLAGFIQKPYPIGDLMEKVREALKS